MASNTGSIEVAPSNSGQIATTSTAATTINNINAISTSANSPVGTGVRPPFVTMNALGQIQPVQDPELASSLWVRDLCTVLGRVISRELLIRTGSFWRHSVWTSCGKTSKSYVVRAPSPLVSANNQFTKGIQNLDLQRINAVLRILEIEYDFILDLY